MKDQSRLSRAETRDKNAASAEGALHAHGPSVPVDAPIEIFAPVPLFPPSDVPDRFSRVPVEAAFAVRRIAPFGLV